MLKEAVLYKKLDKPPKAVQCNVCEHHCIIQNGAVGICGIRLNKDGKLYVLNYGQPIAVHLDPIEKKPFYHFYPGSKAYSIGFLGCNFRCSFCQNWDIAHFPSLQAKEVGREKTNALIEKLGYKLSPKEIVQYCVDNKISSIAYTYNEPTITIEFVKEVSVLAKEKGIKNVWVSNGYISKEGFDYIKDYIDAINIDLKSFSERFYLKHAKARLEKVKENIKRFFNAGIWVEISVLIIPDENDSEAEIRRLASFIKGISPDIPVHFNRFYPDFKMLDKPITTAETLLTAYNIAKGVGLNFVYVGNIDLVDKNNTYCPKCNNLLIKRDGLRNVEIIGLEGNKCKQCGEVIPGRFDEIG